MATAATLTKAMESFKDHFSTQAKAYADCRPSYPVALAQALAEACVQRTRAWDAGCGNGQLAVLLAQLFDEVVATDASAEQLAHATPHARLRYRRAAAEAGEAQSGLAAHSVDLCVAAQAAHWFDMDGYLAQLRRVSKQDAVIALVSYGHLQLDCEPLQRLIGDFYTVDLAPFWPPERRHVESGYRDLPFPFEPIAMPALSIERQWNLQELLGYLDTWSAVVAMRKAGHSARVTRFRQALEANWPATSTTLAASFPLSIRAGRMRQASSPE